MSSSRTLPTTFLYAGALALAALAALIAAPAADAAFPGQNGRIAFHDLEFEEDSEIFSINPDGTDRQQLTDNELDDFEPAWSPDGTRIIFYRVVPHEFGPTTAEIWVMNADGSNQVQLTTGSFGEEDDPSFDSEPAFSGDGTRVVFTRQPVGDVGDGDSEIWIMNADGSGQTQLTDNFVTDIEPTINPASTLIAWSQEFFGGDVLAAQAGSGREMQQIDMDIVTSDLSGQNFRIVTDVSPDDEAPNFSPDGSTIAFARCVLDEDEQGFPICEDTADIFSVPTNGDENDVTQLTGGGQSDNEIDEDPAYSPDGTQMVFSRFTIPAVAESNEVDPRTVATGNELQLAASSGGASTDLTVGYNGDWQPIQPAGTPQTPGTPAASEDLGTCRGHAVTIAGTPASETIVGTPGDDVIKGRKGNDRIKGLDGDDYICGQRGRDKLFGNVGDDTLIGGQSRDFLKGGPGIDTLFGGTPGAPDDPVPNICAPDPGDQTKNCKVG